GSRGRQDHEKKPSPYPGEGAGTDEKPIPPISGHIPVSLSVDPNSIAGGGQTTLTLELDGPASGSDVGELTYVNGNLLNSPPTTIRVPEDDTFGFQPLTANPYNLDDPSNVTITVKLHFKTQTTTLTIHK